LSADKSLPECGAELTIGRKITPEKPDRRMLDFPKSARKMSAKLFAPI
jgi:hypothetical protein